MSSAGSSCRARDVAQRILSGLPISWVVIARLLVLCPCADEELYPDPRKMFDNMDTAAAYQGSTGVSCGYEKIFSLVMCR